MSSLSAWLYQKAFDSIGLFVPEVFLSRDDVSKESFAFEIYVRVLKVYVSVLRKFRTEEKSLVVALQEKRLQRIVSVASKTGWWGLYFRQNNLKPENIKSLRDLDLIPPVGRATFVDVKKEDLLLCPLDSKQVLWRRSGGSTTGTPLVWGSNKTSIIVNTAAPFLEEMENQGFCFEDTSRNNFYVQFNYPHPRTASPFKWFLKWDFTLRIDGEDFEKSIEKISQTIEETRNCVLRSSPVELSFLLKEMKSRNLRPPISFCLAVGQRMEDNLRHLIQQYFGCKVIAHYGMQETGPLALECTDNHGFYHIFSERMIVEILDNNGKAVPLGRVGSVTVTCLDNTLMPLIRYQPGDQGVLHESRPCECANKSPLLEIQSRTTDVIRFSDGTEQTALPILRRFGREPFMTAVRRFQVRQETLNEVTVLLELRESLSREVLDRFKERMSILYGGKLKLHVQEVLSIKYDGPKFKVFVPLELALKSKDRPSRVSSRDW